MAGASGSSGSEHFADDQIDELLKRLADGESMRSICSDRRMPNRSTVDRWAKGDDDLAASIVRAREIGYYQAADKAVEDAKAAKDAALGRLAFDAERWRLSKLARAFQDKVTHVGGDESDNPINHKIEATVTFVRPGEDQS
jgi:hypothetical protein